MLEVAADFLTNCAFWDMQMRSLARFSDFLGQVPEDYSTDNYRKVPVNDLILQHIISLEFKEDM